MNMTYTEAYGLLLKLEKLRDYTKPIDPERSVLVSWASICLANVYTLADLFKDDPIDKFRLGVKNIRVNVDLTLEQVKTLDALYVEVCLWLEPTQLAEDVLPKSVMQPPAENGIQNEEDEDEKINGEVYGESINQEDSYETDR